METKPGKNQTEDCEVAATPRARLLSLHFSTVSEGTTGRKVYLISPFLEEQNRSDGLGAARSGGNFRMAS
jgi:hypothetical protein